MHWATDTGVLGHGASVVPTTDDHSRRSRGVIALTSTPGNTRVSSAEDVLNVIRLARIGGGRGVA